MKKHFLIAESKSRPREINTFSNKSAMVLTSLFQVEIGRFFGVREIKRMSGVSLGLTQKVITYLEFKGAIEATGQRTKKAYRLFRPEQVLIDWINFYRILDRCKLHNYKCFSYSQSEIMQTLIEVGGSRLALHSACRSHGRDLTNLKQLEVYLDDFRFLKKLEAKLNLEKVERGYDILFIEPYYKNWSSTGKSNFWHPDSCKMDVLTTPKLLTILDLFHYPLRGREQAERLLSEFCREKKLKFNKILRGIR